MSIHKSYFSRNNTLIYNSYTNTGRNPVTELFFGTTAISQYPIGYSRFIFDLDLDSLIAKLTNGVISTTCSTMKHTLRMTNTSNFDIELLNTFTSQGRLRATSFDLLLLRIPPINFDPSLPQIWDEGVGYDFADLQYQYVITDRNYSTRPSNWFETTTIGVWEENGIYNNRNLSPVPFSALTLVAEQHFEFGDENIEFDMTNEINGILNNTISGVTGWVIAYKPQLELFSGLTDTYEVQFFTRHTQTFYEPHLDTSYNDLIEDDRNLFTLGKVNKLYLYLYEDGNPLNLDFLPLINADYTGGIIIYDWYSQANNPKEQIKISVQFLSDELRSDSVKITAHKKICDNADRCSNSTIDQNFSNSIKENIITAARTLKIEEAKKEKK